ncbi:Detected protein of confused Function [Hibiscus syriacus]|uniref:Detected protein of confused Function n=1 Tax=Hibiscus syriacus TaxID=106335 RepID=A0A6A2XWC3_HIBSY|nr:Detected protein of confused Function [Hibiscus syriacus]
MIQARPTPLSEKDQGITSATMSKDPVLQISLRDGNKGLGPTIYKEIGTTSIKNTYNSSVAFDVSPRSGKNKAANFSIIEEVWIALHHMRVLIGIVALKWWRNWRMDVINFEEYVKRLTDKEQQQLLQYLPPLDFAEFPDSLENMFESPQFKNNLCYFQKLLEEGVFNVSLPGVKSEDCKILKRLVLLFNLTKSNSVEGRHVLKKCKISIGESAIARGPNAIASNNLVTTMKRSRDSQCQNFPEERTLKVPRRTMKKVTHENKEDNDSFISPRSRFALPHDGSTTLDSSDGSSEQCLLLDVPSNGSFPLAP